MLRYLPFFLITAATLFAEQEKPPPVASIENEPHTIVGGKVSAITGDVIISEVDLYVPSAEPLCLERYITRPKHELGLYGGWQFSYMSKVHHTFSNPPVVYENRGANYCFYDDKNNDEIRVSVSLKFNYPKGGKGITNVGRGRPSARTNIKNWKVKSTVQPASGYNTVKSTLENQSGEVRKFKSVVSTKKSASAELLEVSKPSGFRQVYDFIESKGKVISAYAPGEGDGYLLGQMIVSGFLPKNAGPGEYCIKGYADDGRTVHYFYGGVRSEDPSDRNGEYRGYIKKVDRPNAPVVEYTYYPGTKKFKEHLKRVVYPEGRYWEVEYIVPTAMNLGPSYTFHGKDRCINPKIDNPLIGSVHKIFEPAGPNGERVCTYRFNYIGAKDRKTVYDSSAKLGKRMTEIYNVNEELTTYHYNDNFIPWQIVHYEKGDDGGYTPYCYDKYCWVGGDVWGGNMNAHFVYDPERQTCKAKHFAYDITGNVVNEGIWGIITGESKEQPDFGHYGSPLNDSCERAETSFTYTNDGFNSVKTRTDPNRLQYVYNYMPDTDLVISELVYDHGQISRRTFHKYNENHILVETIVDDGSSLDVGSLEGVCHRFVTRYKPIVAMACRGLPEEISYFAVDVNTQEEKHLRRTKLHYNVLGQIEREDVYDAQNEWRYCHETIHNDHGCLVKEISPTGEVIQHQYDGNDNLIYSQGPHPKQESRYTYDKMNRLTSETVSIKGKEELYTKHTYDCAGNRVATLDPFGHEIRYICDQFGRIKETYHPLVANENGSLVQPITMQKWDIFSRKIAEEDAMGNVTLSEYNVFDQPLLITCPDGTSLRKTYNIDGTIKEYTAQNGMRVLYTHDSFGRLTKEETFAPDGELLSVESCTYKGTKLISRKDPQGNVTRYEYDFAGRESAVIQGNAKTTTTYDTLGNVYSKSFWDNKTLLSTNVTLRDVVDRVVEEWVEDPNGEVSKHFYYTYDCFGNKTQIISADRVITKEYDAFNRVTKEIDALGNQTFYHYNHDWTNEHGQKVLQTTVVDPKGNKTITTYDTHHRDVLVEKKTALNALVSSQEKRYDLAGNCVKLITHVFGRTTPEIQEIHLSYDSLGRLTKRVDAAATLLQRTTKFTYNSLGQKENVIKPDGTILSYTYDGKGRLKTATSSDNTIHYTYVYDQCDRIVTVYDAINNETTSRKYTPRGELSSETLGTNLTNTFTYDGMDRLKSITLPDKSSVKYTHNSFAITSITRKNSRGNTRYTHRYSAFDDLGNVKSEILLGNAGQINKTYDKNSQLTSIDHPQYKITEITYDPTGNITKYTLNDPFGEDSPSFSYDPLHQLTSEMGEDPHTYTYDSAYNRTAKDTTNYSLDSLNQLKQEGNTTYKWDLNGNLKEKATPTDHYLFTYDALNRLIKVVHNNQPYFYTYDSFNRRLTKRTPTHQETYLYQGDLEVGKYIDQELVEYRVLGIGFGSELNATVAIELEDKPYAPLHDFNGNITHLIDSSAQVVESFRYTAFGEISKHLATIQSPWQFSSKRIDPETSFVFFGRRHYDPNTGRWTTTDPLSTTPNCNLYAYVMNCPLTHFDLHGLFDYYPAMDTPSYQYYNNVFLDSSDEILGGMADPVDLFWGGVNTAGKVAGCFAKPGEEFSYDYSNNPISFHGLDSAVDYQSVGRTFINGINTDLSRAMMNQNYLKGLVGHNQSGLVYNPTLGTGMDVARCGVELFFQRTTPVVQALKGQWMDMLDHFGYIVHTAHSEGCLITRNALQTMERKDRDRIFVIAVAPAAYIDKNMCADVIHLVSRSDPISAIDQQGFYKHQKSIKLLHPAFGVSQYFDHDFQSPTFAEPITEFTNRFVGKAMRQME